MNKTILVCGAGGFIGTHLVNDLKAKGHTVIGIDIKKPLYEDTRCNQFYKEDLRDANMVDFIFSQHEFDEVYQLAADMGGAGYIFVGENDADIMHNSATINLNVLESARKHTVASTLKIFYSSSACMYPEHNQLDPDNPDLAEDTAYPANPDSDYGWEKLFSERLYLAYGRCYNMNVKIARFHNIFGPQGSWNNGKEKAPAALCRKVAMASSGDVDEIIDVWGPGNQTRSFLFIDECVEGIQRIMESDLTEPVNLGSTRKISINELVLLIAERSNKRVTINNIDGPRGVMGRTSDNKMIKEKIDWAPDEDLETGIDKTCSWILTQIESGVEDV